MGIDKPLCKSAQLYTVYGAIAISSKFSELRSADFIRQGNPCATLFLLDIINKP